MDRISSLPDDVITHILSFLPTKEAALTSVLAKRWRILFAFSPNLFFVFYGIYIYSNQESSNKEEKLKSFVDRVLSVSGHSPIKKFTLYCNQGVEPAYIKRWLCDVLNRGVVDLDLTVDGYEIDGYSLPFEIFICKTLEKLKLCGFSVYELPENAFLPALKTLSLDNVKFHNIEVCAFKNLLSACPVLKDLSIRELNWDQWKWCRSVSSPSLQRLTTVRDEFDEPDFGSITFDTPSLTYLKYCDYFPGSYSVVNLHSLVEANLDLTLPQDHTWEDGNITINPTNLIKGFSNVGTMSLLSWDSLEMFYFFREAIPVYENLLHLSTTTHRDCYSRGLVYLLNSCPNLEVLTIEGCDYYPMGLTVCECLSEFPFLLSCPVKILRITKYKGTIEEKKHLQHFLGKFSSLKLLEVKISGRIKEKSLITKDLLMLPRASSKCKIKITQLHESVSC